MASLGARADRPHRGLGLAALAVVAGVIGLASSHDARAQAAPVASGAAPRWTLPAPTRARLDNGLRVVMLRDTTSPTVAVTVAHEAGSREEARGQTGFARLLGRMMFQGSINVHRGEHVELVAAHAGTTHASIDADLARYSDVLPATELPLALWLEADRLNGLDLSPRALDAQRRVLAEEGWSGGPSQRLEELVFQGYWPYEHGTVAWSRDVEGADAGALRAFHDAFHAPDQTVVAVAGNIDEAETLAMVKRWFGAARRRAPARSAAVLPLPAEQTTPRYAVMEGAHATAPLLLLGWAIPPLQHPDHDALEMTARLLGEGEGARLSRLVGERGVATRASARVAGHRGPDAFTLSVEVASRGRVDQVAKAIDAQLAELARSGPGEDEMRRLRAQVRSRLLAGVAGNLGRAERLAATELLRGDASLLASEIDRATAVTSEDIRRVTARYLTAARRSVVEVKPGGEPPR